MYSALSTFNTMTEMPLSKAPNPQLLRVCVRVVCVHLGWVNAEHKFRVWATILGYMSLHVHFLLSLNC